MRSTSVAAPDFSTQSAAAPALADLRLKVVTPMFGGGVKSGVVDPDLAHRIRGTSIRGQLRFWWRACNAAVYPSLEELHKAESWLWGSARNEGKKESGDAAIRVRVRKIEPGRLFVHQAYPKRNGRPGFDYVWERKNKNDGERGPDYALFPFKRQNNPPQDAREGVIDFNFEVSLSVAPHAEACLEECTRAARQALWAWITFGGLGARTRRGCGSLYCLGDASAAEAAMLPASKHFIPPAQGIDEWIRNGFKTNVVDVSFHPVLSKVPSLVGARVATGVVSTHLNAWNRAIAPLQRFTQGEDYGRNPGLGQSRWPEVSAARLIADVSPSHNGTPYRVLPPDVSPDNQFPRADLGLPRSATLIPGNENSKAWIERAEDGASRMPSPVLTKALAISESNSVPLLVILNTPYLWEDNDPDIRIEWAVGPQPGERELLPGPMNAPGHVPRWPYPNNPPPNVQGAESARDAFWAFALSQGWRSV